MYGCPVPSPFRSSNPKDDLRFHVILGDHIQYMPAHSGPSRKEIWHIHVFDDLEAVHLRFYIFVGSGSAENSQLGICCIDLQIGTERLYLKDDDALNTEVPTSHPISSNVNILDHVLAVLAGISTRLWRRDASPGRILWWTGTQLKSSTK